MSCLVDRLLKDLLEAELDEQKYQDQWGSRQLAITTANALVF